MEYQISTMPEYIAFQTRVDEVVALCNAEGRRPTVAEDAQINTLMRAAVEAVPVGVLRDLISSDGD